MRPLFALRLILCLTAASTGAAADDLGLLSCIGKKASYVAGPPRLTASADGRLKGLQFSTGDETLAVAANDFIGWSRPRPRVVGPSVLLANGAVLPVDSLSFDGQAWTLEVVDLSEMQCPGASVVAFAATSAELDRFWLSQASHRLDKPALLLTSGDVVRGEVVQVADDGWRVDGVARIFSHEQVDRALFMTPPAASKNRPWTVALASGALLHGDMLYENEQWRLIDINDLAWPFDPQEIVLLNKRGKTHITLSDLSPADYRHVPWLRGERPLHVDRNATGGLMRHRGAAHLSGLGLHSASRLAYRVPQGGPWVFAAEVALDDSAGVRGSVVVKVFTSADGANWTEQTATDVLRGGADAVTIRTTLDDAAAFAVTVDYADNGDVLDRVNLMHARLETSANSASQ